MFLDSLPFQSSSLQTKESHFPSSVLFFLQRKAQLSLNGLGAFPMLCERAFSGGPVTLQSAKAEMHATGYEKPEQRRRRGGGLD